MLCPLSAGKSSHQWLNRLRAARGFPESDVSDLENFLQNPNRPVADTPEPKLNAGQIGRPHRNGDRNLRNIVSGVLNELFYFGDGCSSSAPTKKSSRKQTNPKICAFSDDVSLRPSKMWRCNDSSSRVVNGKELDNKEKGGVRDKNLAGFSRTEVTVIDTSYAVWKFEKILYRKKNVWKVRDKRGKSEIWESKKRKQSNGGVENKVKGGRDHEEKASEKEGVVALGSGIC